MPSAASARWTAASPAWKASARSPPASSDRFPGARAAVRLRHQVRSCASGRPPRPAVALTAVRKAARPPGAATFATAGARAGVETRCGSGARRSRLWCFHRDVAQVRAAPSARARQRCLLLLVVRLPGAQRWRTDHNALRYDLDGLRRRCSAPQPGSRRPGPPVALLRDYLATHSRPSPGAVAGRAAWARATWAVCWRATSGGGAEDGASCCSTTRAPPLPRAARRGCREELARGACRRCWRGPRRRRRPGPWCWTTLSAAAGRCWDELHGLLQPQRPPRFHNAVYVLPSGAGRR